MPGGFCGIVGFPVMPNPILALWAVPRSVSTAFERMMAARGDLQVFNEPFSGHYYYGPNRSNTRFPPETPAPSHDPAHVRRSLLEHGESTPVFFKDMAYHISTVMSAEFLEPFTSSLLIRDPRFSIPSLHRRLPDFTREETGFEQLLRLARILRDDLGREPLIIDGEVLRADPESVYRKYCDAVGIEFRPDSLQWEPGEEKHWSRWTEWYQDAASSAGFRPPAAEPDPEALKIPRVAEAVEYCLPIYEELSKGAIHV